MSEEILSPLKKLSRRKLWNLIYKLIFCHLETLRTFFQLNAVSLAPQAKFAQQFLIRFYKARKMLQLSIMLRPLASQKLCPTC